MLIGRDPERAVLTECWASAQAGRPQLVALWGRRRVGKTYLATQFAEGKRAVYFTATRQDSEQRQVERYMTRLTESLGEEAGPARFAAPTDWEMALRLTVELAREEPLLVVVDEMPRLLHGRRDFADLLSAVWEGDVRSHRLMLLVTGSAVSVMEDVLGADGGLRGRPQAQLRLDPFDARAARSFLPALPPTEFLRAYAVCGGYPLHLQAWDVDETFDANVERLAGTPGGLLLEDALDIMSEDLDWRSGYERVLTLIGGLKGVRRKRIAGRAQQRVDYTLDRLARAGFVTAEKPLGAESSRAPLYRLTDVYLAFWFAVLRDESELIEGGQGRAVLATRRPALEEHVAAVFEAVAREHAVVMAANGLHPEGTLIGRWWQDEQVEIDVLGLADGRSVLVGEAKWQAKPFDSAQLQGLRARGSMAPAPSPLLRLGIWCPSGATDTVGQHPDVDVHTAADMIDT